MSSSYSNLKFELITTGEQSGLWGATTNTNIGTAIEQALVGMATLTSGDFPANVATLTLANINTAQNARALCLNIAAGAVSSAGTLNVPAIQKPYLIINDGSFAVTVKVSGLTGVVVPAGKRTVVYNNGTDVGEQINYLSGLTLGTPLAAASGGTGTTTSTGTGALVLATSPAITTPTFTAPALGTPASGNFSSGTFTWPTFNQNTTGTAANVTGTVALANGGSGATTAATARTNFGATSVGSNFFTLANPSAITFVQINADNTITTMDAATFRTAIGAGSGTGSVTSVAGTGTVNGISLSGTVTSSGNITLGGALTGVNLTTQVTGTLPVANGGTGATTSTGSGAAVLATNPTLSGPTFTTPALGTPTSGNFSTGTFTWPTFNQNTTGTASNVTGVVAIANGGTGASTAQAALNALAGATTSANFLRGNGSNVLLSTIQVADVPTLNQNTTGTASNVTGVVAVANGGTGTATPALVAGTNITISGTWPNQTINSTASGGGGGTVTNIATGSGLTGGPITSTGTINLATAYGDTVNPYASKTANFVLAAPNGSAGLPTFRAIVAADIPTLNQSTTGTASNVTGVVAVANGGTGATNIATALSNLGGYPSANPAGYTSNTGTVTSVGGTGSVSGLSLSGTVTTSGNLTLGGTLAVAASNFTSQTANTVLAAPNGAAGVPTFRTLVAADIPTLNQNTTGTAANVTGAVAVANGGTGVTTLSGIPYGSGTAAFTAATGAQVAGAIGATAVTNATNAANLLTTNYSVVQSAGNLQFKYGATVSAYIDTTGTLYGTFNGPLTGNVTGNVSGTALNVTGTVAVGNGGTGVTTSTGSGSTVLSTSPSLTTPTLTGFTETILAITDGVSIDINPANGTIQTWTLGANRTPSAASFANGQSVTLMITSGSFTVTWTTIAVTWVGGTAPVLQTGTNKNIVVLWKVAGTVYGNFVGSVA